MDAPTLRDYATDAIRWWEPKRIAYNVALAAVVSACFLVRLPASKQALTADTLLFLLKVTATVRSLVRSTVHACPDTESQPDQPPNVDPLPVAVIVTAVPLGK